MPKRLLADTPGETHLLLGNEAIARGALEAGVGCVTCYPGTPSSEVPDLFFRLCSAQDLYFEYSVNEKVALEVAGGASLGGLPALVTMKHVGVNVAADPLMTLAYIGTPGGLLLLSADDPGCHSSQNEQDNRAYARLAGLPCFEPATAQEAKDMTREGLLLSAKWQQPVMLRTSTRVNHLRGAVRFDPLQPSKAQGSFSKDPMRFVPIPAVARQRHPKLLQQLAHIEREIKDSGWNTVTGQGPLGIISSGVSRAYVQDALPKVFTGPKPAFLEFRISYPLAEDQLLDFLRPLKQVVVIEELEPFLETTVREIAQRHGLDLQVFGKGRDLPRTGEYSTRIVVRALSRAAGKDDAQDLSCPAVQDIPGRPPNLCVGCPHRALYYAVRQVFGDQAAYASDIGCYTLGVLPPLKTADFLFCMGSSISGGSGLAKATGQDTVAFIGDSTFFHSGLTGLVNAVYNQHNLLVVILDNQTTAMTGHQPHPGVKETALGVNPQPIDLEKIVSGCGVKEVQTINPFHLRASLDALDRLKGLHGVRVLISRAPCPLFAKRVLKKGSNQVAYVAQEDPQTLSCAIDLACPAFQISSGRLSIDEDQCTGCMLCVQACPGIKARKRRENG